MKTRFDGFYAAQYEGLNEDGRQGFGVVFLKDGKIYGGDSLVAFMGKFDDSGNEVTAHVHIFGLVGAYHSVAGFEDGPWSLPDIRGQVPEGSLPPNFEIRLDGERYEPRHHAVSIKLWRIAPF